MILWENILSKKLAWNGVERGMWRQPSQKVTASVGVSEQQKDFCFLFANIFVPVIYLIF